MEKEIERVERALSDAGVQDDLKKVVAEFLKSFLAVKGVTLDTNTEIPEKMLPDLVMFDQFCDNPFGRYNALVLSANKRGTHEWENYLFLRGRKPIQITLGNKMVKDFLIKSFSKNRKSKEEALRALEALAYQNPERKEDKTLIGGMLDKLRR
jgi:hypothetical protein